MFKRQTFCHDEPVRFLKHEPKAKIGKKKKKEGRKNALIKSWVWWESSVIIV